MAASIMARRSLRLRFGKPHHRNQHRSIDQRRQALAKEQHRAQVPGDKTGRQPQNSGSCSPKRCGSYSGGHCEERYRQPVAQKHDGTKTAVPRLLSQTHGGNTHISTCAIANSCGFQKALVTSKSDRQQPGLEIFVRCLPNSATVHGPRRMGAKK